MTDRSGEPSAFTQADLDLPVELHQGGSTWSLRLLSLSLVEARSQRPADWDAQYNEPFTLRIQAPAGPLELHAYLQDIDSQQLTFSVQHVDRETIEPLRALLAEHVDDPLALDTEIDSLD